MKGIKGQVDEDDATFGMNTEWEAIRELPNLPRVTDHFFIPGFGQYLVMDFVDGIDLGQLVRNEGPIAPERALDLGRAAVCQRSRVVLLVIVRGIGERDQHGPFSADRKLARDVAITQL